jgi:hypothetical protein
VGSKEVASRQVVEKHPSAVILNPSLCHSEGAKRLKNLSFRVNSVKELKYSEKQDSLLRSE